jgi:FMN-dependent NADH-azoreductase
MKILEIKSSILSGNSVSSKYADKLVDKLKNDGDEVIVRDVGVNLVTQLTGKVLGELSDSESDVSKEHLGLIDEIKSVDVIVLTAPMYNFMIPSTLKNYFDAITKAGITFKYGETGPVGLIEDKPVYVIISRGGKYQEYGLTFQEDYLKMHLNFIGLKNVKFVFLEGIAMGLNEDDLNKQFELQIK